MSSTSSPIAVNWTKNDIAPFRIDHLNCMAVSLWGFGLWHYTRFTCTVILRRPLYNTQHLDSKSKRALCCTSQLLSNIKSMPSFNFATRQVIWLWYCCILTRTLMYPSVGTSSPLPNTSVLLPLFTFYPKVLAKPELTKQCDAALSIITDASWWATCLEKLIISWEDRMSWFKTRSRSSSK